MAESALRQVLPSSLDRIRSQEGQMLPAPAMQQQSLRGAAFNTMYDMFGGSSEDPARRAQATRRAEGLLGAGRFAADMTPVVGDALAFGEARDAYRQGNMGQAAILGGLATLGMVPIGGDVASRAIRSRLDRTPDAGSAINIQGVEIPIREPSDNINKVMKANFQFPSVVGNQTLNINDIYGGVRLDANEKRRVDNLSSKILGQDGFISRIIVDQDNNVIEGQHRLEALRQLGAKEVPVYKIEDLSSTLPIVEMENAINNAGTIHPDNVNQIMQYASENIAEYGIDGARDFDFGNYQKYYDAALDAAAVRAARSGSVDMSTEARMQRAADQGYTDRLTHSSSEVFAGSPQAEEAMGYGIPIQTEFKKTFGGTYFAPEGSLSEDIFSKGPFGGSAEYLLNKGNNFNANFRNMSEAQKKELTEIIGSVVDADDIDNAFDVFTDGDFYQTYGRKAQDNLMNAFSRRGYDSVTFPDNLAMGDLTQSTVVFDPSNIRSVNAAFDPANRGSANILAGGAGAAVGLSALRQFFPQEEERPID